jgi:hypothetical protein
VLPRLLSTYRGGGDASDPSSDSQEFRDAIAARKKRIERERERDMEDGICVTKEVDVEVELSSVTELRRGSGRRATITSREYAEDDDEEEMRISGTCGREHKEREWPLGECGDGGGDEKGERI